MGKIKDITGEKYNRLTAIKYVGKMKAGGAIWLWQCDCGNQKEIPANSVKTGNTKSCGCLKKEQNIKNLNHTQKNISGERFGFLTVIKPVDSRASGTQWECLCDCGNKAIVSLGHL